MLTCIAAGPTLAQQSGADAPATLNPGDKVQITVWRMPELSGEFLVGADGTITHPLYHAVKVTGVPVSAVEERVRGLLVRLETNPQFVVQPLFRVAVGGEVNLPNLYNLAPETTVAQAVAQAGGATEQGNLARVRLVRGSRAFSVDVASPGAGLSQMPIRSGDQIIVERKRSVFREYVVPLGSVIAGIAGVVSLIIR